MRDVGKNDELTIAEAYCCRVISAADENEAKGVVPERLFLMKTILNASCNCIN